MKRRVVGSWISLVILAGGVFFHFRGKRYEVMITQEQIDTGLEIRFPATKRYLLFFRLTYENPQVKLLEEGDRVQVGLDATLNIRIDDHPSELGGGATVTSRLHYHEQTQEFYLIDSELTRLEIQGVPEKWSEVVMKFASQFAKEYLEAEAIYKLEANGIGTGAAKLLLKGFEVREQAIYVTLGL